MNSTKPRRIPAWTFGDRLRKARRDAGLSQTEMAYRLGTTDKSVANWESGASKPRDLITTAQLIEEATGVSAEWLVFGTHNGGVREPAGYRTPSVA